MATESNPFGGKSTAGIYVPLSEDEQEVLERLVQMQDVKLVIHGWGIIDKPVLLVGEHRVTVKFRLTFKAPAEPMPVYFFDLELLTHQTGISLFRKRMPCTYDNKPIWAQAGTFVDMAWDIALHSMDPRIVKLLKPGATGFTSRRQDKDTGLITSEGNMKLDSAAKRKLAAIEKGAASVRLMDKGRAIKVTRQAGESVHVAADGKVTAKDVC